MEKPLSGPIGVLGGTYDPVHIGHLLLAEQAAEQLGLHKIVWIPAATAPHPKIKQSSHHKHRLEMVRLATAGNTKFTVDDRELQRGGQSYTVDTLEELSREHPDTKCYLLMGSDSLTGFPLWRDPQRICQLAHVIVVVRGGQPDPDLSILGRFLPACSAASSQDAGQERAATHLASKHLLQMPQLEISSTDIRERVKSGRSIRYMVPGSVEAYIDATGLYRE